MATPEANDNFHFDIHASVVFQLGQDLITDEMQALVELVKNAYDADSTYAKVTVDTKTSPGEGSAFPNARGYIRIEDNGTGMTPEDVRRGWLTISNSLKRAFKAQGMTTGRGRTPLGDKGLGRLGAQRLGYNMEIFTRPAGCPVEYHVSYSWRQFQSEELLSHVAVKFEELPPQREQGTTLIISDLNNSDIWVGDDAIARFRTDLSRMISPYEKVQGFTIAVTINGKRLDLVEFTKQVRQTAQVHYDISFDGTNFCITGRARLSFFQPEKASDQERFRQLVSSDDGNRLFVFLSEQREAKQQYKLKRCAEAGWYVEFSQERTLGDLDGLALVDENKKPKIANPGPFHAEVDAFNLGKGSVSSVMEQNVFNLAKEYRDYIKTISGIRVYRDGFAIRVEADWLNIGGGWNSARSFYGLKPTSTIGFISLSAKDNAQLEETTNRESFKVTPYYHNFREMLRQFLLFTEMAQEFLRRGYNEFHKAQLAKSAQVRPEDPSTEELSRRISQSISRAETQLGLLERVGQTFDQTIHDAQEALARAETQPSLFGEQQHVQSTVNSLTLRLGEARNILMGVEAFVKDVSGLKAVGELLDQRLQALRDQLAQVYEMVSLGMTAEALSHEINNVADQLAYRTQEVSQQLREQNSRDVRLIAYIEYVYASLTSLQKQLSHLAPSLQYMREKRELIRLNNFFADTRDYFQSRFSGSAMSLQIESTSEFTIRMNRGKLSQVMDNLLLNSQYWLQEDLRVGRSEAGTVSVEVVKPFVRLKDSGRGIDPSVEESLFEAFVTTKGREQGRGLGLFIVRQLLDSEGCTISLLPERNAEGRLYIFEINFTGALAGDE